MDLTVRHQTDYSYQPPAPLVAMRLRLFPASFEGHRVTDWRLSVNGAELGPLVSDCWGDREALWFSDGSADAVSIVAEGRLETEDRTGVIGRLGRGPVAVWRRETELTRPDEAIRDMAAGIGGDDALGRLHELTRAVAEKVVYRPGMTSPDTTAPEALAMGQGVCQDQSHVFISAARSLGIPARYVAGYLLDSERDEEEGEQTHAWAEAHVEGLGWVGFDITHQLCPTDAYIRLASGFDAADAAPIRGTAAGETESDLTASVHVEQTAGQSQQ